MADKLFLISIIAFVLSAVFLVAAVVLWMRFDIAGIIGDLSGLNAKKSIKQMREYNTKTDKSVYKMNYLMSDSRKLLKTTEKLETAPLEDTTEKLKTIDDVNDNNENGTVVLSSNRNSDVIGSQETIVLTNEEDTVLLNNGNTVKLVQDCVEEMTEYKGIAFDMIEDLLIIHTQEVI